tara:strand:+ start:1476 stop:1688 length:213 start_codon:yes stop_codon:yes gene_type:complete
LNEEILEQSFLKLYDEFLKLNLHIEKTQKKDIHIKKHLTDIILICEDIAEYYYYAELARNRKDGEESETH